MVICAGNPPRNQVRWKNVDRVGMNNDRAMESIVAELTSQGCRTVLHAAGWSNNSDAVERRNAFEKAVRKYKLDGDVAFFGIIQTDGRTSMEKYLSTNQRLPDAIVCFNDSIALGILEAWHARAGHGKQPPFALTGWDDSPAAAAIGLTSVNIPFSSLGEEAARLLNLQIDQTEPAGGEFSKVELSLIRRESSHWVRA